MLVAFDGVWRCHACGLTSGDYGELMTHVWTEHAAQILRDDPWLYGVLEARAARQAELQRQVFGRT